MSSDFQHLIGTLAKAIKGKTHVSAGPCLCKRFGACSERNGPSIINALNTRLGYRHHQSTGGESLHVSVHTIKLQHRPVFLIPWAVCPLSLTCIEHNYVSCLHLVSLPASCTSIHSTRDDGAQQQHSATDDVRQKGLNATAGCSSHTGRSGSLRGQAFAYRLQCRFSS